MTTFVFEAARADGAAVKGQLDAPSAPEAAALLSSRGLFPIAVEPRSQPEGRLWGRPSTRALATVIRSLAALVQAGVPLTHALAASERVATGALREALARVATRVREGASLGSALAAEHGLFSGVTVGLVRAGERGVGLGAALDQAAVELESRAELAARVRAALAYPALLALVGTASVVFIVGFVVPRFAAVLGDLAGTLPLTTRTLIGASALVRQWGVLFAAALPFAALGAARLIERWRAAWHAWLLGLPLVGPARHALATARTARTLGALLGTGLPAFAALAIAEDAAGDRAVAARLARARDRVAEGAGFTAALSATAALTENALRLAAIGEGAGSLPALLLRAADLERREAERRLHVLVTVLEPALIIGFAGVVAFVAAALLQAVYGLSPGTL